LLVGFGLIFSCLLLEVGLRIAAGVGTRQILRHAEGLENPPEEYRSIYDQELGFRGNPKFADHNSDGLRDHPIRLNKDTRFRVLFLGDSIAVWGEAVDDTFVGYLRAELCQHRAFRGVEVINAGVLGYTNYQELLYLKKYGLKFQPDLVGVQFCLNDLQKFQHAFQFENGQLVRSVYFSSEAEPRTVTGSWARRLARKSYLLMWLRNNLRLAIRTTKWQAAHGFSFDYNPDLSLAWYDKPWKDIERQLQEMIELGRRNGFSVFLVLVPIAAQYNTEYLARDRDYVLKPQRKLREICQGLGIPFLDLYPELDRNSFVSDGAHLGKEGRRQVGRRIATFLVRSNLLPAGGSVRRVGGQGCR